MELEGETASSLQLLLPRFSPSSGNLAHVSTANVYVVGFADHDFVYFFVASGSGRQPPRKIIRRTGQGQGTGRRNIRLKPPRK